jgi:hypothetical protein
MSHRPKLEQILSEPAGRRVDAWVAEYVMGWRWVIAQSLPLRFYLFEPLLLRAKYPPGLVFTADQLPAGAVQIHRATMPKYSENGSAAWDVVLRLFDSGWEAKPQRATDRDGFCWTFSRPLGPCRKHGSMKEGGSGTLQAWAETAPLAICRAALRVVLDEAAEEGKRGIID